MHHLFVLFLLGFSVATINCRPSPTEENNENQEELEYEEDSAPSADDNLDDSRFGDEDTNQDTDQSRRLLDSRTSTFLHKNLAEDQSPRTNADGPDYKAAKNRGARNDKYYETSNNNDELQTYGKRRRYTEKNEANEQLEAAPNNVNRETSLKSNRVHNEMLLESPINKRTYNSKKAQTEEGELLFGNRDQTSRVDRNDYFNEPVDLNQHSAYVKQYNNQAKLEKGLVDVSGRDNDFLYYNRDRRETKKSNPGDESMLSADNEKDSVDKTDNENEELAIKRHIKKMTGDELEQLLNSLSDEKKALLKKIMEDEDLSEKSYDSINKREITKKAGAVEDNGFIDSGQSESSKLQGGFTALEVTSSFPAAAPNAESTSRQTESSDGSAGSNQQKPSQDTNTDNKPDNANINRNSEKSDNSYASDIEAKKDFPELVANGQAISKNENKRETNSAAMVESLDDSKVQNEDTKKIRADDSYFFSRDEDMSQFLDDVEQSRSYDSSKIYKRDVDDQLELDSKLKSLEESFPSPNVYDESGPYSGPLIRVKRKDTEQILKKRSAAILPEAKVGFCPYKSENTDEDSDEGNEFDDEGFYDPTPNLVSNDNKNVNSKSESVEKDTNFNLNAADQLKSSINDDTMNLGSDTDNVLSGVEGVDENLMFSSGLRNRRKSEKNVDSVEGNNLPTEQIKELSSETKSNDINVPNYQDNDSFGGLPRSYEGDLGRFKRIRRVKQSHVPNAPLSA